MLKSRILPAVFMLAGLLASHALAAEDANVLPLEEIEVRASGETLTQESAEAARYRLERIPGGTNLVRMADQGGRQATLDDALGFEPGVTIQEFFGGNDQPRLNIRGSGIQSNPQSRGVQLLQNGLPLNLADGSYIISQLNTRSADYIEVYRGANGLRYGAATLGGAINLVSPTGHGAAGQARLGFGAGSFKALSGYADFGEVFGATDLYALFTHDRADGFRRQSESERAHLSANLGHRFRPDMETRLFVDYFRNEFNIPGPLSKAELQRDPKVAGGFIFAGPNVLRDRPRRDATIFRLANKNTWLSGAESSLAFNLFYQNVDDDFTFPMGVGVRHDRSHEWGAELRWAGQRDLFNAPHELELGLLLHFNQMQRRYFNNRDGQKAAQFADNDLKAGNVTLFMQDRISLTERLALIAAAQFSHASRNIKDNFGMRARPRLNFNPRRRQYMQSRFNAGDSGRDQDYFGFNPKLGLHYTLDADKAIFANLSRSFEPPTFDELLITEGGTPFNGPNNFKSVRLDAQTATTLEFGARGSWDDRLQWDISAYRSWVKDEILTITDTFGIAGQTRNSPDTTIHQGLETGLKLKLLDSLSFNASYNWSDFFFAGGVYADKQIAGVPEHFIHAELMYRHQSGFYLGPNLEWMPARTPTDHNNTVFQDRFALLGLKAGYKAPAGNWSIFLDGRNLTDKTYASSYLIRDRAPPPIGALFIPGAGMSITAGFELRF